VSILITGTPGSGKTSLVAHAITANDSRFFDADEIPGLCEWREFDTGKVIGLVSDVVITSDDEWYKKHGWYWKVDCLQDFLATTPQAIVCGSSENIADCYKLFDRIIMLRKTEAELLSNLQSPDRLNPFGKTTKQRAGFMEWQDYLIKEAQSFQLDYIDGNSIEDTFNKVVALTA
jgi:hypothetical protein